MNITNNSTTLTDLVSSVQWVADNIGLYAIPYSAAFGFTFKICLMIILSDRSLNLK